MARRKKESSTYKDDDEAMSAATPPSRSAETMIAQRPFRVRDDYVEDVNGKKYRPGHMVTAGVEFYCGDVTEKYESSFVVGEVFGNKMEYEPESIVEEKEE